MNAFIDEHRARCGVEPICSALQIAPSVYGRHAARQRNPALLSARAQRDAGLLSQVQRVYEQNLRVYGADKVWRQLGREGTAVARCTVERLMRLRGLQGARRGKSVRTTVAAPKAACPQDRVNRQFKVQGRATEPAVGGGLAPTSGPGRGSSTWPSSSMSSPGASSAGGSAPRSAFNCFSTLGARQNPTQSSASPNL